MNLALQESEHLLSYPKQFRSPVGYQAFQPDRVCFLAADQIDPPSAVIVVQVT